MDTASSPLELALREAVEQQVFPGAVAAASVRTSEGEAWVLARAGRLEPEGAWVELDTVYDLASLTKPVVATVALRLVQQRVLDLHRCAADYVPELRDTPGGEAPLHLLLSHRGGLSAWGSLYKELPGPLGSAESRAFMLRAAALRTQEPPTRASVYSDLGYLVAGEAISRAAGARLDALVEREITRPLGLGTGLFYAAALDDASHLRLLSSVAPTERCVFRGRVVRAEVHDENCAAYGGIAGHAGLFGTASAVVRFGRAVLDAIEGRSTWLDRALVTWALRPREGGSHVVGWDTKNAEGSSAGALFSQRSFGHLGFTGTSIWCDPARSLCAVLLSNRVHPTRDNVRIRELRPRFHDLVIRTMCP